MDQSWAMSRRRLTPEIMDDPALDAKRLHGALRGIARLNRLARSSRIVSDPIIALARRVHPAPLRVLDIATGAGDVPVYVHDAARRHGLTLDIHACDCSGVAIDHARERAARAGARLHFFMHNIITQDIREAYDVVVSSLFLHHLSPDDAITVLRKAAGAARRMVVISDLRRTALGFALAFAASRLVTKSDVVHEDALRSVRAAFSPVEVRELAARAGLSGATVERRWPQRLVLIWNRS